MKKIIILLGLFLTVLALVSTGFAKKATTIRYASYPGDTVWLTFAKEKGFFKQLEKAGINLEIIEVGDKVGAFASGGIDFGDIATTSAIVGAGKGAPFKIVANMYRTRGPFFLIARPEFKAVEELRGKKVGVSEFGTGTEIFVRAILKKHGLDPDKDVTLVANGGKGWDTVQAGLEAKQVDATIIEEPFVTLSELKGVAKLLANGWDYLPSFHTGVLVASDKLIKENPAIVKSLIKFYFAVYQYAKNHQDEWAEYFIKAYKLDPAVEKKALERTYAIWENIIPVDLGRLAETQKIQVAAGIQKESYDIAKIVDKRFAK